MWQWWEGSRWVAPVVLGGALDDKVGEDDERDARESSPQPGRRLRGGKMTGRRETGHKEMGHRETGCKETGRREKGQKERRRKEMGGKTNGSKERGVRETVAKESGGKETIVKAMGVREMGGIVSGGKATGAQVSQATGGKGDRLMSEREPDNSLPPSDKTAGQNAMEGIHRKSYSEAVKGRVENIVGSGKDGSVLVHVGTNNIEREGTTAIVRKYRHLVRTLKQTQVEQVILSGILPVIGRRGHRYRNCRGMAINMLVEKLCREEEVGFVGKFCACVVDLRSTACVPPESSVCTAQVSQCRQVGCRCHGNAAHKYRSL